MKNENWIYTGFLSSLVGVGLAFHDTTVAGIVLIVSVAMVYKPIFLGD